MGSNNQNSKEICALGSEIIRTRTDDGLILNSRALLTSRAKMCHILKTADRRAKQIKISDSLSYELHMFRTFHVSFFEFHLGLIQCTFKFCDVIFSG